MTATPGHPEDWADTNPEPTTRLLDQVEALTAERDRLAAWKAEAVAILDYRGEQQRNAEHERDEAQIEVARLQRVVDAKPRQPLVVLNEYLDRAERAEAAVERLWAVVARVDELLDHWDVVDKANSAYAEHIGGRSRFAEGIAARAEMLRAALAGSEAETGAEEAGHRCEPYYSRAECGQCGGQEQWCETCSRQMCGCEPTGQEGR